jgi:hypothetical protein
VNFRVLTVKKIVGLSVSENRSWDFTATYCCIKEELSRMQSGIYQKSV